MTAVERPPEAITGPHRRATPVIRLTSRAQRAFEGDFRWTRARLTRDVSPDERPRTVPRALRVAHNLRAAVTCEVIDGTRGGADGERVAHHDRKELHPLGLTPKIINLGEWRGHLLRRLRGQVLMSGDPAVSDPYDELVVYCDLPVADLGMPGPGDIVVPLRIRHGDLELSFVSTVAMFETPMDVTMSELALELFFPADETTAEALRAAQVDR